MVGGSFLVPSSHYWRVCNSKWRRVEDVAWGQ